MSKLMRALFIQLTARQHTTQQSLHMIEQELITINKHCQQTHQTIANSCTMPTHIIPEHEKTRSLFMRQQHHQLNELERSLSEARARQKKLQIEHLTASTTLNLLEKQKKARQKRKQDELRVSQQNTLDEWILLRREPT